MSERKQVTPDGQPFYRPRLSQAEYEALQEIRHKGLQAETERVGTPSEDVKHYWQKTDGFSLFVTNPNYRSPHQSAILDQIRGLLDSYEPRPAVALPPVPKGERMYQVTLSDAHVGLDPNPEGLSLYPYEYNAAVFRDSMQQVIDTCLIDAQVDGPFEVFVLDLLGDALDGWNGLTTRGGHELPQNMTNEQALATYIDGIMQLLESVVQNGVAGKYVLNLIENDNHSGSFASVAGVVIQMLVRPYGDRVQVRRVRRFMEHYYYGDHAFILTHGKDKKHMKRGLPFDLTKDAVLFIQNYIKVHKVASKHIHVHKGDLHRSGYTRRSDFDYINFMTFAPPSAYGQHNFDEAYAGFTTKIVPRSGAIRTTDHLINLNLAEQVECNAWRL